MDCKKEIRMAAMKMKEDQSSFDVEFSQHSGMSHENSECVKREKSQRMKIRKRRVYNTKSKGNWNFDEDARFMIFMICNRESFENKEMRRSNKIFKKMAKYVKSRCPQQCRSHHQKYEKKYITFDSIVDSIKKKVQPELLVYSNVKFEQLDLPIPSSVSLWPENMLHERNPLKKAQSSKSKDKSKLKKEELTQKPQELSKITENDDYHLSMKTNGPLEFHLAINLDRVKDYFECEQ